MNAVFEAARELGRFLEDRGWRYCLIGGLVVPRWGQPRATQDVDVSLLTGFGSEEEFIDDLLTHFPGRIPDARLFALNSRVLLARATNQVALDISLAGFPYEERVMDRSSEFEFAPGLSLRTVSAEDLIVLKALAGRPHDWTDIQGVVTRQGPKLDWSYIERELPAMSELFDTPHAMDQLRKIRRSAERGNEEKQGD